MNSVSVRYKLGSIKHRDTIDFATQMTLRAILTFVRDSVLYSAMDRAGIAAQWIFCQPPRLSTSRLPLQQGSPQRGLKMLPIIGHRHTAQSRLNASEHEIRIALLGKGVGPSC